MYLHNSYRCIMIFNTHNPVLVIQLLLYDRWDCNMTRWTLRYFTLVVNRGNWFSLCCCNWYTSLHMYRKMTTNYPTELIFIKKRILAEKSPLWLMIYHMFIMWLNISASPAAETSLNRFLQTDISIKPKFHKLSFLYFTLDLV